MELERWARTLYGLGAWTNAVARHWTVENGYKNWIGRNTTDLISRAHSQGLKVHLWTVRNEDQFLAWDFDQDIYRALEFYQHLNADGIFTDFPATAVRYFKDTYGYDQDECYNSQDTMKPQTYAIWLMSALITAVRVRGIH